MSNVSSIVILLFKRGQIHSTNYFACVLFTLIKAHVIANMYELEVKILVLVIFKGLFIYLVSRS